MTDWKSISDKVQAAERLNHDDGVWLFEQRDIIKLGKLAQVVRKRLHGDKVYFNKNRHINPTNVCAFHCNFCSFARTSDKDEGAYTFMANQLPDKVRGAVEAGVREFHIVGGLHPELGFEYYLDVLETLKKEFPHIHLKAFTAVEIDYFAKLTNMSHEGVLKELVKAGLDSMPGGGAEIFHWDVRKKICPEKADQETWLAVHDAAHKLGLKTNATMLYGHIEKPEHRIHHMIALREQQDKSGGFQTFIALAFHPEENNLGRKLGRQWTTGVDDIKTLAISRLMLDNFSNIKAYWVMLTPALAQVALNFGANDMDGTIIEEHIYKDAGAKKDVMTVPQLMQFIRTAGYTPVERDTVYNELEVFA